MGAVSVFSGKSSDITDENSTSNVATKCPGYWSSHPHDNGGGQKEYYDDESLGRNYKGSWECIPILMLKLIGRCYKSLQR